MTTRHPVPTGGDDLGGPDIMPQSGQHGIGRDRLGQRGYQFLTCGGRPRAFPRKRLVRAFTRRLIAQSNQPS